MKIKSLLAGLVLSSSLLLGACTSESLDLGSMLSDVKTSSQGDKVEVKNIVHVDGDTIKVDYDGEKKVPVRFLLVDTPESKHPKLGVQPYGKEASEFTETMIKKANKVELEFEKDGKRDKYGRLLAYVYADGKSVQEALIKNGYARVGYIYKSKYIHLDEYKQAEKEAIKNKKNIWSKEGYVTQDGFGQGKPLAQVKEEEQAKEQAKVNSGDCTVKANTNTKKFHVEGGQYYETTTKNFVCFSSEGEASEQGYVKSKR